MKSKRFTSEKREIIFHRPELPCLILSFTEALYALDEIGQKHNHIDITICNGRPIGVGVKIIPYKREELAKKLKKAWKYTVL